MSGTTVAEAAEPHCVWCGRDLAADPESHARCRRFAAIQPPRFCGICARRMVVQVTPAGWTATCSRHGTRTSA